MSHNRRRAASIDPEAILELLATGPSTFGEIADVLNVPNAPVKRAIRALHETGRLYVRGDLVAAASYYMRSSDGLCLAAIRCAQRTAEQRPVALSVSDSGSAA